MQRLRWRRNGPRWGALLAGWLGVASVAVAQTGTVTGRIAGDDAPGAGLEGARISVVGTNTIVFSGRDGRYTLRNLAPGALEIRVVRLGYQQAARSVSVAAGGTAELDFVLTSAPFTLDEIVTTATGQQRKAELGNVVNTLQVADLAREAPITSMAELLSARAPGVTITQSSGTTGTGNRVRIRGATSMTLSNEPLLVVDGIRVENGATSLTTSVGGQAPSRLNDFSPDEIESIEIVKGPSAAALYGTRAANGVILITTKRGSAGAPRWHAWTGQALHRDATRYPSNYIGLRADSDDALSCNLDQVNRGVCTIAAIRSFNPMEDPAESPLGDGRRQEYGMSVAGGSDVVQYFLSAEQEWERGIWSMPALERARLLGASGGGVLRSEHLTPNALRKTNLRANIGAQVTPKVGVQVTTGLVNSVVRLPQNDNNVTGILSSALTGSGRGATDPDLTWGFFRPGETFQRATEQRIQRLTTSANTTFTPTSWLSLRSVIGLDLTASADNQLQRFGEGPDFITERDGTADENRRTIQQYTVDLSATATRQVTPAISSKTTGGIQWYKDSYRGTNAAGDFLPPGSGTITSGAVQAAAEVTIESITLGSFVEQQFGYKDRLYLTAALRADRNSAFGQNFGTQLYPKASLSYLLSDETWFPSGALLSSLRLRGSFGKSGLQPRTTDALLYFNPVTAATADSDQPAVTLGGWGNQDLRPETSREVEVGFDATFFASRIALEGTFYNVRTRDALLSRQVPLSVGLPATRIANIGSTQKDGIEVTLNAEILKSKSVSWDATLTGAFTRLVVRDLGEGITAIPLNASDQQARVGTSLGGYWARTIQGWTDHNSDGVIGLNEVNLSDTLEYQGPALPTRELGLASALSLFQDRVRLAAQFDYRGGHLLWNLNEEFRCRSAGNCIGRYDNTAPERERLRYAAVTGPGASRAGYFEKADFLKLREVSVTVTAPGTWTRALGLTRLALTVAGRNLHTWTGYTGLDPELNGQGQGNFATREFLTQPPTRNFSARFNLAF